METGDPANLFSNLLVLYLMYGISYRENSLKIKFKNKFLSTTKAIVIIMALICFLGWINIFTIKEFEEQYFISFSETMRLGNYAIINVHIFFLILAIKMSIISGAEWVLGAYNEKNSSSADDKELTKTKGA